MRTKRLWEFNLGENVRCFYDGWRTDVKNDFEADFIIGDCVGIRSGFG